LCSRVRSLLGVFMAAIGASWAAKTLFEPGVVCARLGSEPGR
jgi:hypothetical protein